MIFTSIQDHFDLQTNCIQLNTWLQLFGDIMSLLFKCEPQQL